MHSINAFLALTLGSRSHSITCAFSSLLLCTVVTWAAWLGARTGPTAKTFEMRDSQSLLIETHYVSHFSPLCPWAPELHTTSSSMAADDGEALED